ncbi:M20 family metallo-hydrolase [Natronococcus sp. A-GB7]|uniref:M20 family metallo-hydrolase n=1 Tax=Natronococcus sp. A-GB7 TaxID=3037649 RepID=UPI00241E3A64|nr:M20 family metallo-hydrolase [Natronococcus sp. A-GB7]MDG5821393.1 M20 family metallo-hydrolase [Natronococcus sp. A-GB7]
MQIDINRDRLVEAMNKQASIGGTANGGLHRLALSDADKEVRDWFVDQLNALGMNVRIDEIGNIFGRRAGTDPTAPPVLVGSHLDSQPNGGIYDGQLGVIGALEILRTLEDKGIETSRPIEIVNWTNEEGARFQPGLQGSGVWSGEFNLEIEYERTDRNGARLVDELERIGYRGDVPAEPAEDYEAYFELHIEQGPYLEANDKHVGVVTGIVGLSWGEVTFDGHADHAGATPMHLRSDAAVPAAELVTNIRRLPSRLGERTVGTVGSIDVRPDSINIIPETASVTWDVRDPSDEVIARAVEQISADASAAATREGIEYDVSETVRTSSVKFEDRRIDSVQAAADELGYDSTKLLSGGAHDASHVADVCEAAMIFAVSEDGKSHTPAERTSWDDCQRAVNTLANAVLDTAGVDLR